MRLRAPRPPILTPSLCHRTHQDYSMYSANQSLVRLFLDGLNTRNPELTNIRNPGDKNHTVKTPEDGVRSFATPAHEIMARALLGGSVGLTVAALFLLPALFRSNYDQTWEKGDYWGHGN